MEDFQFNISHSGDYCVLAADSQVTKLGVDVMKVEYSGGMQRLEDFFRIMKKQFSDDEWKYIRMADLSNENKLARFIRLWSLKESYVKAEGSGITFPLSKISFTCCSELKSTRDGTVLDSIVKLNDRCLYDWNFEESMIDEKHYVSVAKVTTSDIANPSSNEHFNLLSISELISNSNLSPTDLFSLDDEQWWTDFCRKE